MTELTYVDREPPTSGDGRLEAACTLDAGDLKERLGEWIALRDRSVQVRTTPQGALLQLAPDEALDRVARLVDLESECCEFYRFSLRVSGAMRELDIDAGPGGAEAVKALLSIGS